MFKVAGLPILADEMTILEELRDQLALNGIERFHTLRPTSQHIQFNCPFHKGGQERKPSCGITTVDIKRGDGSVVPAGTVHCFTCGYTGSIQDMISRLFGYNDFGMFGIEWLRKNFTTISIEKRELPELTFTRGVSPEKKEYIPEEILDTYRYIHPYMYQRKLTDDVIDMFDVGYDKDFVLKNKNGGESHLRCITFPVRDETGGTLFVARRSVDTKFFHYPSGVEKPVYGLYELSKIEPYPQEVIICESIINCLTCFSYGKYAVALNGTGTPLQYEQLKKMPTRKFILGLDPDEAGFRGRQKLRKALSGYKLVTEYDIPPGKDINDLTKEEFLGLKELL